MRPVLGTQYCVLSTRYSVLAIAEPSSRPHTNPSLRLFLLRRRLAALHADGPVLLDQCPHLLDHLRMFGVLRQVRHLVRIRLVVVELRPLFAVVPFGVTPALGTYRITGEAAALHLRVRRPIPRRLRVFQERL